MTDETDSASRSRPAERERLRREAALDETIEQSFPASDPPSSNPNPDSHTAITPNEREDPLKKRRSTIAKRHDVSRADRGDLVHRLERTSTDRVNQCWAWLPRH
jgi:hypothetical protein